MIRHLLEQTLPKEQRLGQWFVNLTGYHGPDNSKLFYVPDNEAAMALINGILERYQLTEWTALPVEQFAGTVADYFKRPPWKNGMLRERFIQNG